MSRVRVAVLGATGHTGRLLVRVLREREHDVIACGRNPESLAKLKGIGVETRTLDVRQRERVHDALTDVDAVANLAGPFLDTGDAAIEAAITRRIPYVDTTGEQAFMYAARAKHHEAARLAEVPIVNAVGFEYAYADLAAHALFPEGGDELHILYRPRHAGGSAGTKKSIARVMASTSRGHENGRLVTQTYASHTHRFATLDGPRDGISFPGGEILTVPSHTPFATIRTYVPGPASRARTWRAIAPLARIALRGAVLDLVERAIDARHEPPDNEKARGEIYLTAQRNGVERHALVATPDPYLATAEIVAEVLDRIRRKPHAYGVIAPAQAVDAADTLDALRRRMPTFRVERLATTTTGAAHPASGDDKPI